MEHHRVWTALASALLTTEISELKPLSSLGGRTYKEKERVMPGWCRSAFSSRAKWLVHGPSQDPDDLFSWLPLAAGQTSRQPRYQL